MNAHFFENQGIIEIGGNSSMEINPGFVQTSGATILNEGSFMNLGGGVGSLSIQGGELKGKGMIMGGINNQGGAISPGLSMGCLTIVGALTNTGDIVVEIGGRTPCDEFDAIFISGTIAFGGTLDINFTNGFAPNLTDTFPIIYYSSRASEFENLAVSGLPGNRSAYLEYGAHQLEVKIQENVNVSPQMQILSPSGNNEISIGSYMISWTDEDPDDDAVISLMYSPHITAPIGTTIADNISEDDENDFYAWDTSLVPEGIYWIQAEITDVTNYPD
jgi:hypothetical protein